MRGQKPVRSLQEWPEGPLAAYEPADQRSAEHCRTAEVRQPGALAPAELVALPRPSCGAGEWAPWAQPESAQRAA